MNYKILFFLLVGFIYANESSVALHVESNTCSEGVSLCEQIKPIVEVKAGYFVFSNHLMRKIYSDSGWDVQLCTSYPIWKWIQIYGSIEYLNRNGRSLGGHEKTQIGILPLNLGVKFVAPIIKKIHYYVTAGPRYSFILVRNHSSFVPYNLHDSRFGGFVNTGFNFFPCCNFFIDIFGECSYTKMHFFPHTTNLYGKNIQVGGFTFGGGIGYTF